MFIVPAHSFPGELAPPPNSDDSPVLARQASIIRFGRCEIRIDRRELFVDGVRRDLQPRPFELLVHLVRNSDQVVTREELLSQVWDDASVQRGSLPAAVLRVRRALGQGHQDAIRTYQRVGYRFVAHAVSHSS